MKNIAQTPLDAKQVYLSRQAEQMLVHYQQADSTEQKAIIRQIDSFFPVTSSIGERTFWIEFKDKLKILNKELAEKTKS